MRIRTNRQRALLARSLLLFLVSAFFTLSTTLMSCSGPSSQGQTAAEPAKPKIVRLGYQKSNILVKSRGVLEKRLPPQGISVEWTEFQAGPPLLEALNVGSIDIGPTGESPPIFAQAAGTNLVYVAAVQPSPKGQGILVPKESPIRSVSELKGKKIAFTKASSAHYLLVSALKGAGLEYSDIEPVFLSPADARAAFLRGSVDAWVVWDPFFAAAEGTGNARVLLTGITKQGGYYLASRTFVEQNPNLLKDLLEGIDEVGQWADTHPEEVAKILSPVLGIDLPIAETMAKRRFNSLRPIDNQLITLQQQVADTYFDLKLLPKPLNIRDATLAPEQYASITPESVTQKHGS
ncbi:sulfonate ABC transporter substrate-binding protein [Leptolyngbya sp. FACHB-261]|uniref:sulfonate ABC transporter substrate-binding protein n=1 Tax=Leptolyngbya sp. FACHB-261 TaxID=2692806 RepID=UPI001685EEDF|nr:sulfonate ABC transporter substrate-binding protein [Leptolyngbya sp. FACHB-261]MBD2101638.1 sulfonate ABC transporter substrate-binding protein [Leptolyngbya sp. FACHB-261]